MAYYWYCGAPVKEMARGKYPDGYNICGRLAFDNGRHVDMWFREGELKPMSPEDAVRYEMFGE